MNKKAALRAFHSTSKDALEAGWSRVELEETLRRIEASHA